MSSACQPFIIAAITVDGFIAQEVGQSSFDWTSKEDKKWHVTKTKEAGCVIFGRTTFETFNKPLPGRLNLIYSGSKPEEFAQISIEELQAKREAKETQLYYTQLSPAEITEKLGQAGYSQLSVSGGATVYQQFLESGVAKRLFISIEPIVFGQGRKLFSGAIEQRLKLVQIHHLSDQTKCLEYEVVE